MHIQLILISYRQQYSILAKLLKQNASTPVWKHLVLKPMKLESRGTFAALNAVFNCQQEVGTKNDNTSNLYSHLKKKHPKLYTEVCKSKFKPKRPTSQSSLSEVFKKVQPLSTSSCEHAELTRAVVYCLAKDMLHCAKDSYATMVFTLDISYRVVATLPFQQWLMKLNMK